MLLGRNGVARHREIARSDHRKGDMLAVRIHGRGGQGVVSGAELLSVAAFNGGRHAQAFPSFGSERMGAPVMAFCRIDTQPIRLREPVLEPDALIIQDPTLLHQVDLFAGLHDGGLVLINSTRDVSELGLADWLVERHHYKVLVVPATEIALKHVGRAVPNVPLLAAFAAVTGSVTIDAIVHAIEDKFPAKIAASNVAAAREAYALVKSREVQHA
jgi:pyruvate ferredoxin oxidoreductase gamma subunit